MRNKQIMRRANRFRYKLQQPPAIGKIEKTTILEMP
jgi:hypothetical protein